MQDQSQWRAMYIIGRCNHSYSLTTEYLVLCLALRSCFRYARLILSSNLRPSEIEMMVDYVIMSVCVFELS